MKAAGETMQRCKVTRDCESKYKWSKRDATDPYIEG